MSRLDAPARGDYLYIIPKGGGDIIAGMEGGAVVVTDSRTLDVVKRTHVEFRRVSSRNWGTCTVVLGIDPSGQ